MNGDGSVEPGDNDPPCNCGERTIFCKRLRACQCVSGDLLRSIESFNSVVFTGGISWYQNGNVPSRNDRSGSVFINPSLKRSLSSSPDFFFSIFRGIVNVEQLLIG